MKTETERKFLVKDMSFKRLAISSVRIRQGYIAHEGGNNVRVRTWGDTAFLTIKGPGNASGMSRPEWEKEIPVGDALDLLGLCHGGIIDKTRHMVPAAGGPDDTARDGGGRYFEVDEFHGQNEGLIIAEIELGSEDEAFVHPSWLGEEVTGDPRYYNSYISAHPLHPSEQ